MRALTQHMHPIQVFRLQAPFFPFAVSFYQRRAALLLATALTGSLVLMPALTTQVRASEIINGTDETVIGTGVGTLPSTWDHTGSLAVGRTTTGTLTISEGGTVNTLNNGVIGYYTNAQGTVTVDGADSTWTMGSDLRVGSEGHGTLVISNGGAVSNTQGYISFVMDDGGTGAVTVTGLGSTWTNTDYVSVGYEGTGTLTISDRGTVTSVGSSYVGSRGTGTATVTGAGSTWTNTGNIQLGFKKASTLTIADGGEVSASNLLFGNPSIGTLNIGAASGSAAVAAGTLSAATVSFGRTGDKIVFNHTDTDYTFAAAISGAGSVNVLSGTTKLTGANTYSGGTTISGGTLQIGDGGTTGSLSGNVTNNSAMIFSRSDALSYGGDISGTGSLTKSGTGTLTLTGANSFSGGTTISGGTLQIGNGGTTGSLSGDVTNNGAMIFNRSDALTYGGDISGTGSLTKSGAETLTLTGTNSYTGGTTVNGGVLKIGEGGSLTGDIVNNSAMVFDSSTAQSLSSALSGNGTLTKSGTGTLTLTGNNTYTGGTTISGGTLQVGDGGTSGSLSGDVTNNSALAFNRSDALSYGGVISGTGSLTKSGAGTLTLSGSNTYDDTTTVTGGTLSVSTDGNLGAGALTLNGGNFAVTGTATIDNAVALSANATITNSANATLSGGISGTGSLTKSGAGTLSLTGTNSYTGGTTISAGTLQVGNGGTTGSLSGNVTNNSALIFNRSDALSYGGNITGTGTLTKSGAGTLTLTGTNSYTGGTTISVGALQVGNGGTTGSLSGDVTNTSALIFNRSNALSYGGDISGTGSLTKSGAGTLTLTGTNTHTGGTTISGGMLTVNGSTGAITLNGGTLGGSGTVGNVTANSGSTIAPGNSIGTLNVAGNTSFAAGSTYAVEVDSAGNADKIAATGTATIDSGATVSVSAENGTDDGSSHAVSTTYTILTANTGVTGTFGSVSENFAFLDASLSYDASNVYLKLWRNNFTFASSATTANQRATADALDTLGSGNTVYDAVSVLSAANARAAFDSLSGEIYASANGLLMRNTHFSRDAIVQRMRATFDGGAAGDRSQTGNGVAAWGRTYGNWGQADADGNAAQVTHSTGGVFLGADAELPGDWRAGLLAGYGASEFDSDARASSASVNTYHLGGYAGGRFGNLGVRLGSTVAWHDLATARNVKVGSFSDTLSADYSAATAQVSGELGYLLDSGFARFEPFAGAALVYQHSNGFRESGGAAGLSVGSASQTLGITTLGVRAETHLVATEGFSASLTGTLGWRHAFGDVATNTSMRFASGDAFQIAGPAIDRDTASIEAGLKLDFNGGATVNLDYHGDLGASSQNHGFNAKFSASF